MKNKIPLLLFIVFILNLNFVLAQRVENIVTRIINYPIQVYKVSGGNFIVAGRVPLWFVLSVFIIFFSLFYHFSDRIFKENRNPRIAFSVALSLIIIFATPFSTWVYNLILGFVGGTISIFFIILPIILFALLYYYFVHATGYIHEARKIGVSRLSEVPSLRRMAHNARKELADIKLDEELDKRIMTYSDEIMKLTSQLYTQEVRTLSEARNLLETVLRYLAPFASLNPSDPRYQRIVREVLPHLRRVTATIKKEFIVLKREERMIKIIENKMRHLDNLLRKYTNEIKNLEKKSVSVTDKKVKGNIEKEIEILSKEIHNINFLKREINKMYHEINIINKYIKRGYELINNVERNIDDLERDNRAIIKLQDEGKELISILEYCLRYTEQIKKLDEAIENEINAIYVENKELIKINKRIGIKRRPVF